MDARPYRRRPPSYALAVVFAAAASALLVVGLILDLLPEEGSLEWNGLPLGEYGTGDLVPTIVPLGIAALVCSVVALRRTPSLGERQRTVLVGIVAFGTVGLILVILAVGYSWIVCGSGACE